MKKSLCALLGISLCIMILCSCTGGGTVNSDVASSSDVSSLESETLQSDISSETTSSKEQKDESQMVSSEEESHETPVVTPSPSSVKVGPYTINDPNNTKGLSTKKIGYGFGVAKNGKPHSISVNNQKYFDSVPQYKCLALDTVSEEKCMYLTFDCGYEYKQITGEILDTLKEKNVKAAFFCTLHYIKSNPKLVRRMIDEGHIVGNHTASHPVMPDLSRTKKAEDIYKFEKYLEDEYGYKSDYFRFPSGSYSENCLELVSSMGYKSIFWSVAYSDWDTDNQKGEEYAYKTVTDRYHPGAVILLHAVSKDNSLALGRMIDKAREDGYVWKSLDEYYE